MAYDLDALMARLAALADADYRRFNEKLIPGAEGASLGVRTPELRVIAREIARGGEWRDFLEASRTCDTHEARLLHAMVLGAARCPVAERIALIDAFLPHVDNWAVCDALCAGLKPKRDDMAALFAFARECARSGEEFRKRFGLVLLMSRFAREDTLDEVMAVYRDFAHPGYYARMGAAWGLATLYLSRREAALAILRDGVWDARTHNMAIRKLIESCRVDAADKAALRALRRRENEA